MPPTGDYPSPRVLSAHPTGLPLTQVPLPPGTRSNMSLSLDEASCLYIRPAKPPPLFKERLQPALASPNNL